MIPFPRFQAWSSPTSVSQYPPKIAAIIAIADSTRLNEVSTSDNSGFPWKEDRSVAFKGERYDASLSPPLSTGAGATPITVAPVSSTMNSTSIPPNTKRYGSLERLPRAFLSPL